MPLHYGGGLTELIKFKKDQFRLGKYSGYSGAVKCCSDLITLDISYKYPSEEHALMELTPEIYNEWRTAILIIKNLITILDILPAKFLNNYENIFYRYIESLTTGCLNSSWESKHIYYNGLLLEVFTEILNFFMPISAKKSEQNKLEVHAINHEEETEPGFNQKQSDNIAKFMGISDSDLELFKKYRKKFITDFKKVTLKYTYKDLATLIIDDSLKIKLSPSRTIVCAKLIKKSMNDWQNHVLRKKNMSTDKFGWISNESLIDEVWPNDIDGKANIYDLINRLQGSIRKQLNLANYNPTDFIENGKIYNMQKHYRFKIYPAYLEIVR